MAEDPSIQISSDDEGTTAHVSWRGGAAKRGAKRKQGAGRCAASLRSPVMCEGNQYAKPCQGAGIACGMYSLSCIVPGNMLSGHFAIMSPEHRCFHSAKALKKESMNSVCTC